MTSQPQWERIVLIGFMASGKTVVGAALARRLHWRHIDLDAEIEQREGHSVAEIFRDHGEARFRQLEAEATQRLARVSRLVLSPGGGWITNPDLRDSLGEGTLFVWLRAPAEEVLRRLQAAGEIAKRPLLRGADPADAIQKLLDEREPLYAAADWVVPTAGREIEDIAEQIEAYVRTRAAASNEI